MTTMVSRDDLEAELYRAVGVYGSPKDPPADESHRRVRHRCQPQDGAG